MRMDLLYLDYNCFQRSFDDPRQVRIQMESLACQEIFQRAEDGKLRLVWSFMHEDETILCPFPDRKLEVLRLAAVCKVKVGPEEVIRRLAESFQRKATLSARDAIHLACARFCKTNFFLSCDDKLLKQARKLRLENPMNPVEYISQR